MSQEKKGMIYMNELMSKEMITSLELCKQINIFRGQEERSDLRHNDLLKVIRNEFEEEIGLREISQSYYTNSQGKKQPMYVLTLSQAKLIVLDTDTSDVKTIISQSW